MRALCPLTYFPSCIWVFTVMGQARGTYNHFHNILRLQYFETCNLSREATREATRTYHVYKSSSTIVLLVVKGKFGKTSFCTKFSFHHK